MNTNVKEILVIGLGLIGSSLAKAAKNKGLVVHGFDEDKNSLEEALNKNIIDNSFESLKDIKFVKRSVRHNFIYATKLKNFYLKIKKLAKNGILSTFYLVMLQQLVTSILE